MIINSLKIFRLLIVVLVFSQTLLAQNNILNSELKTVPNWFNLDAELDKINGISTEKAYQTILKEKKASQVVVAIIDSGVETDHIELKGKVWTNEKEIPNNGIDDDKNGYVDDINGWDFLGNKNGDDIAYETLELTREYSKYAQIVESIDPLNATKEQKNDLETFKNLKKKYEDKKKELDDQGGRFFIQLYESFVEAKNDIKTEFKVEEVTDEILNKITLVSNEKLQKAKRIYKILNEVNLNEEKLAEGYEYFNPLINYGLNEDYDGRREVVGDNAKNLSEKGYGNNEVEGPNAYHGTHVAGIIAAERDNAIGIKGVCENAKLMILRAVPSGDERDKDVGNAIKYAVDNGAKIINMSFGKSLSPEKEYVDDAVKYAEAKGVLLIHASGNDNLDLDKEDNFPNKFYKNGGTCNTWIEVGAISWKTGSDLTAEFSNYGKNKVDIFAPGVDLYSLGINGKYREMSGTSMAAPVVTGVAALLLSYYPNLTAIQLKDIILESCHKIGNKDVYIPGKTTTTQFKNLSTTGGIVNAYNALKLAQKLSEKQ